jgi:hypothetical protein
LTENPFEIPQALRDVAEQNMKQAHAAYEQLTDFVTKAMDAWMGAMPSPMAAGVKDVQGRAMQIATETGPLNGSSPSLRRADTIEHGVTVLLMCMAVIPRGQGAVKSALSISTRTLHTPAAASPYCGGADVRWRELTSTAHPSSPYA